jgi:hypothetical protein
MKISEAYPSKFLRSGDVGDNQLRLRISHVDLEDVAQGEDPKPVLYFLGKTKGMVMNRTNSKVIAEAYGDDTDTWQGREIILYSTQVPFQGGLVDALRVRVPKAAPKKPDKIESGPPPKKPAPKHSDEAAVEETENPAPADTDEF